MPYDLTYKWNLINKTNKQAKYKQRPGNKERTDSEQRGGEGEIVGERRGRVIKEHVKRTHGQRQRKGQDREWEVGGGQGRGESWGKNGDN